MKLERLGNLTTELSSSLVRAIVVPTSLFRRRWQDQEGQTTGADDTARVLDGSGAFILTGDRSLSHDAMVTLIHAVGSRNATIRVLAVTPNPSTQVEEIVRDLDRYGFAALDTEWIGTRDQANAPHWTDPQRSAQVWVLCGDDAAHLQATLAGTACHQALREHSAGGGIVVALGPAAAALGARMIVPGVGEGVAMQPGLAFLPRLVIGSGNYTHNDYGRQLYFMGAELQQRWLGVTIDAAAVLVVHDGIARVQGEGTVTFLDGQESSSETSEVFAPAPGVAGPADQLPVCGLKAHILVAGFGLNLKTGRPMGPPKKVAAAEQRVAQ